MQTVLTESGLYDELFELSKLVEEYESSKQKDPAKLHTLKHMILEKVRKSDLDKEIKVELEDKKVFLYELESKEVHNVLFDKIVDEIHGKLSLIRHTQIQDGMHIFGRLPEGQKRIEFIYSILKYDAGKKHSLRKEIAKLLGYDFKKVISDPRYGAVLEKIDNIGKEIVKKVLEEEKK